MVRDDRGFALLVVVALLALMAALVANFVALARNDLRASANTVELARARALAEAGYALAVSNLIDPDLENRVKADGRTWKVSFDGGQILLSVQDEGGKIDLNWAPIEVISGLLDGLGIPGDVGARILDAVRERRASAPVPKYAPGDIAMGAILGGPTLQQLAQMPFRSVGDLQSDADIDHATFARLVPALTVYSESRRIELDTAPRAVLMAIPGMTAEMADAIVASRTARPLGAPITAAAQFVDSGGYTAIGDLRAATIIANAVTVTGIRFERQAVLSFTGMPTAPVRLLEWRQAND